MALHLLAQELRDPALELNETHIHTIAGLAVCSDPPLANEEPYPLSPLGELQSIRELSRFKISLTHLEALYKFVNMKGGLKSMRRYALPETLEM